MTDINIIADARLTASSFLDSRFHPYYGRLNETRGWGAWCPQNEYYRKEYLQVDMGEVHFVCAVATQGLRGYSAWTLSYKLKLSADGITWNTYKETNIGKVWREL